MSKTPAAGVAVNGGSPNRRHVPLELSEEAHQRLEKLRVTTKKSSQAEVIRDSLRLYEWLLGQLADGFSLQLQRGDFVKAVDVLL